jgi:periplasmic protein TonB
MKKNILNVILALCIVSFSTVAMAQSKSAKPKTNAAKPKAKSKRPTANQNEVIQYVPPEPKPDVQAPRYEPAPPPPPRDMKMEEMSPPPAVMEMSYDPPPAPREAPGSASEEVFQVVEQQAEFPGGQATLFKWLGENIKYPEEARMNKIQGKVILRFIIEKDGAISGVAVLRGTNDLLDKEAVRVVSMMPRWKPGMQRGNEVRSYFTLPVIFKL